MTHSWKRLSKPQIDFLVKAGAFTTYNGEEILFDESLKKFYFNAQEHFSTAYLNKMEYCNPTLFNK